MRDLIGAPEAECQAERSQVETRGWGAQLRALDHFRSAGLLTCSPPDPRLEPAIDHLRSVRRPDGTWQLDRSLPGAVWFDVNDGPGEPSRWLTLRALRVLDWWDRSQR